MRHVWAVTLVLGVMALFGAHGVRAEETKVGAKEKKGTFRTMAEQDPIASDVLLDITTSHDPIAAECGQAFADIAFNLRIGPDATCVIYPGGRIVLQSTIKILRR